MEGIERLETEVIEMNNSSITNIFNYLKTKTNLYEKFNNTEKSIKEMYDYIYQKARQHQRNNVAIIEDKIVYLWAINYFNKSNEELGITKKTVQTNTNIKQNEKVSNDAKSKEISENSNQISIFEEVQN